jgi:hypothetical protein
MLVIYKGNFNDNPSVNFRGQAFEPGKPVEVTQEWFDNCQEMCEVYKPKRKPKPKPKQSD